MFKLEISSASFFVVIHFEYIVECTRILYIIVMLKIKTIRPINAHGGALPAAIVGAVSWRSRTAAPQRCTSCPAVPATARPVHRLSSPFLIPDSKYSVVYSNVNFSWANEMRTKFRLHFDFLSACRGAGGRGESCTQNELPAISFRVLIFNHTTTQTQKIKGWQSKVAHSRSQRTNNWRPVARQMSSCCCFFLLHFLDPLSCCVFESPVIVDAAINARHRFNNYLNYSCWNDYGACKCRALSSLTLSLPVSVSLFVSLPVSLTFTCYCLSLRRCSIWPRSLFGMKFVTHKSFGGFHTRRGYWATILLSILSSVFLPVESVCLKGES